MGFLFSKGDGNEYLQKGGILGPKGMENSAGFKIDTGYNFKDPMDKEEKQAGQGFKGYGTFVKQVLMELQQRLEQTYQQEVKRIIHSNMQTILLILQMENFMVNYLII